MADPDAPADPPEGDGHRARPGRKEPPLTALVVVLIIGGPVLGMLIGWCVTLIEAWLK